MATSPNWQEKDHLAILLGWFGDCELGMTFPKIKQVFIINSSSTMDYQVSHLNPPSLHCPHNFVMLPLEFELFKARDISPLIHPCWKTHRTLPMLGVEPTILHQLRLYGTFSKWHNTLPLPYRVKHSFPNSICILLLVAKIPRMTLEPWAIQPKIRK